MFGVVFEEEGRNTVQFICWNCDYATSFDLEAIQKDRIGIKYKEVKPDERDPKKYFLRCPECQKFNTLKF